MTTLERISPGPGGNPRTTAAAVSSQLVSIPKTVNGFPGAPMVSIYAKGHDHVHCRIDSAADGDPMTAPFLRIASRGSPLALTQSRLVRSALASVHGWESSALDEICPIIPIRTTGDRIQDRPLVEAGG